MADIFGTENAELLLGTDTDDEIRSRFGNDTVYGGGGGDYIDDIRPLGDPYPGPQPFGEDDRFFGGDGNDTLFGYAGDDALQGDAGNDDLYGEDGADTLLGGTGDDWLSGGADADKLIGGSGADQIFGGNGNDILEGGAGADLLTGGRGLDTFRFLKASDSSFEAPDTLLFDDIFGGSPFNAPGPGRGDLIDLSAIDANSDIAGNQAFTFGSLRSGGLILKTEGADTVVLGNTGGAAGFEFKLRIADADVSNEAYSAADFLL